MAGGTGVLAFAGFGGTGVGTLAPGALPWTCTTGGSAGVTSCAERLPKRQSPRPWRRLAGQFALTVPPRVLKSV